MPRRIMRGCATTAIIGVTVAWGGMVRARQQLPAAPVFTVQQANAGKAAYAKNCASCHMPDLSGNSEIPALAGSAFKATWGTRSTKELYDYMSAAMPYGAPSLSADAYAEVLAYILQVNGAVAGESALSATTAVPIGSVTAVRATPPAAVP
jgi:mono/diheme cytochrome c family protein